MDSRPSNTRLPLWIAAAVALHTATPALATHKTVRPDGTGDYATMQAAVNAFVIGPPAADTLIVEAGYYDETVNFSEALTQVIHAPAGPEVTIVKGVTSLPERPAYTGGGSGKLLGLQIQQLVNLGNNQGFMNWESCIFGGGWTSEVDAPYYAHMEKITQCTFRGPTSMSRSIFDLVDCRFEGVSVQAANSGSYLRFLRCTFAGPAFQLLQVSPHSNSDIVVEQCSFKDAENGLSIAPTAYNQQYVEVRRCTFDNLTGTGFRYEYGDPNVSTTGRLFIELSDCRMRNVGTGVRLLTSIQLNTVLERDTIETASAGPGVDVSIRAGRLRGLRISDVAGEGIRLLNHNHITAGDLAISYGWFVDDCRVTRAGGHGIEISEQPWATPDPSANWVTNSIVEHNGGDGIRISGPHPRVFGNLLHENGGDGLIAAGEGAAPACTLYSNTAVGNTGRGIAATATAAFAALAIRHNLTTDNGQEGLQILPSYAGLASFNDSWANGGLEYSGLNFGETNLETDPFYCFPQIGDFELHSDSPCASSGIYGQIGAFGIGCAASTAVPSSAGSTVGLRVAPNPSRGQLSFAWGAGARLNELTVFDLAGRKVWSASPSSLLDGALRWDARDANGRRVPAGVYLARWRAGAVSGTSRMVLLDE